MLESISGEALLGILPSFTRLSEFLQPDEQTISRLLLFDSCNFPSPTEDVIQFLHSCINATVFLKIYKH